MPSVAQKYDNYDLFLEDNIKKLILPYYNLQNSSVTQIKFKDTEKQRAVYKIESPKGTFCLKKVYFNAKELLFVYSAIEWLYRNNINVPRLLPTVSGSRFVEINNMLFILTPWIDGEKCNYDNINNIIDSATNLARMHTSTKKFIPIEGSSKRYGLENIHTSTQKHFEQLLTSSNMAFIYKDKFSKTFLQNFDTNIYLAKLSLQVSSSINMNNLKVSLCHGDYVNKNIIFEKNNKLWVIDFDKCKIDYCVHDISYFLRRLLKRDNTKWDLEIAINSLNLYHNIHPLSLDEYKYILVYLAFPQKYWKLSRDYYNNIKKCNKNSFCKLLDKAVSKNDYQKEFINAFKDYIQNKFKAQL